jgi:hypothetical protein
MSDRTLLVSVGREVAEFGARTREVVGEWHEVVVAEEVRRGAVEEMISATLAFRDDLTNWTAGGWGHRTRTLTRASPR